MTWWHAETSSRTRLSRNCIWNLYLDTKIVIYDAYDDAFAQDDEISAADQRQIWRQSSICQQTSQQTPATTNTGQTAKCTEQGNISKKFKLSSIQLIIKINRIITFHARSHVWSISEHKFWTLQSVCKNETEIFVDTLLTVSVSIFLAWDIFIPWYVVVSCQACLCEASKMGIQSIEGSP